MLLGLFLCLRYILYSCLSKHLTKENMTQTIKYIVLYHFSFILFICNFPWVYSLKPREHDSGLTNHLLLRLSCLYSFYYTSFASNLLTKAKRTGPNLISDVNFMWAGLFPYSRVAFIAGILFDKALEQREEHSVLRDRIFSVAIRVVCWIQDPASLTTQDSAFQDRPRLTYCYTCRCRLMFLFTSLTPNPALVASKKKKKRRSWTSE